MLQKWRTALSAFVLGLISISAYADKTLFFCCNETNDLYRVVGAKGETWPRFDDPMDAADAAPPGAAVLVLADGYPNETVKIEPEFWEKAHEKNLKIFAEYPASVPGWKWDAPRTTKWERGVVASDIFGKTLLPMRILAIHDCHYLPVQAQNPALVVAKVAGFDQAVFGLPKETYPLLFFDSKHRAWIATTKLSQFVAARYAPYGAWRTIWSAILTILGGAGAIPTLEWIPDVRPTYARTEPIPADAEQQALRRGAEWYVRSRLLVHPSDEKAIKDYLEKGYATQKEYAAGWMDFEARPLPPPDQPVGDGSHGILEGYSSRIFTNGGQAQRLIRRSDCIAESAMGLAFGGTMDSPPQSDLSSIAKNLLDYLYFDSIAQQGVRADPKHPAFGLVAWGITNWAWERAFYGDDNARMLLATMASAALLKTDRWDEPILKCILANLRTAGRLGFRHDRIDLPDLENNGWRHYYEQSTVSYAPHYQSYLWACYLWAYDKTGYEPFYRMAENAIRMTMEAYPGQWRWTNGIQQERARMLLPLSWLIRVKDSPEHRAWLKKMADDLLALQDESGAIREEIGELSQGSCRPPQSNEEYGVNETPLLQENGDPVCDMLYTSNFAFLGLVEAAKAAQEPLYRNACGRLAQFLSRIQIRSEKHPELEGAWFRAFDFQRWEYWASNADAGWGAWSIETGWTQGWIAAGFGMRTRDVSLWDLTKESQAGKSFNKLFPLFFP
ncbi:MAG: hypothetical protein AB1656_18085, partial [Candidatus Omnitrophota bacterium]